MTAVHLHPAMLPGALVSCPGCGEPAEITDRFALNGSPHAVEHVKLVCVAGHWSTPPLDQLGVRSGVELARAVERSPRPGS